MQIQTNRSVTPLKCVSKLNTCSPWTELCPNYNYCGFVVPQLPVSSLRTLLIVKGVKSQLACGMRSTVNVLPRGIVAQNLTLTPDTSL